MIGLDTNVLLRWLADDDESGGQAAAARRAVLDAEECYVNPIVLAETIWVTSRVFRQPRAVQAEIVERLLVARNVRVGDRPSVEAALDGFRAGGPGFVDHLIGALNAAGGCETTITFDKRAAQGPRFTVLT